jgi:SAM-dependent methyltransferase
MDDRAAITVEEAAEICVALHLAFLDRLGRGLPVGARIFDLGCGAGGAVAVLCRRGFDAYGVDVDSGGRGSSAVFPDWKTGWAQVGPLAGRVHLVSPQGYRLPFPDGFFDFCFSDQVFEHVVDYVAVFREIGRVLKPGSISLHRFPGPNRLIEGHTQLPVPLLCRSGTYLALWAVAGRRAPHQAGFNWHRTVLDNRRMMSQTFYPTKRQLRCFARQAGVTIEFREREEFAALTAGELAGVRRKLERLGLGGPARLLLPLVAQRYMLLQAAA